MSLFVDRALIKVASGDGGNGMVAWRREKYEPMGGPFGGNGGRGGSVFIEASPDTTTLSDYYYKTEFKAVFGAKGASKNRFGKAGEDLILKVPIGTVIKDAESDEVIADLVAPGQRVLVAEGGRGGRGNAELATHKLKAPYFCEPGEVGITRTLELQLKMIADVGIVGLPNAGKSTLLSILTKARPKIADYPFSTLSPNLGVARVEDKSFIMADIPGLIEGAHRGAGLGHKFLQHIERTRLLVHLSDVSDENLKKNISIIAGELSAYSKHLADLPQIIVLNKKELLPAEDVQKIASAIEKELPQILPKGTKVLGFFVVSCATKEGVDKLAKFILQELEKIPVLPVVPHIKHDEKASAHPDDGFEVTRKKNVFYVTGLRLEKIASVTDMESPEAVFHFFQVLQSMGVIDELLRLGAQSGMEVVIGQTLFTFGDDMR